jgi:aldose 1-epimerase
LRQTGANPPIDPFGYTADSRRIHVVTLRNDVIVARVLTLGGILQDLRLTGIGHALTLGSPDPQAYLGPLGYFGAIIGPVANRIGGAEAEIAGARRRFPANQAGRHTLHSGPGGSHAQLWRIETAAPHRLRLELDLPDGLGGFPGHRRIAAEYALNGAALDLTIQADTDAPTLMNLAHHPYWNLDGRADWSGHRLAVSADRFLPTTPEHLPTGEVRDVTGTPYDLRGGQVLTRDGTVALDHNYCLSASRRPLTPAVRLTGASGLSLEVQTTEPGVQIYTAGGLAPVACPTHDGIAYGPHAGIAIEPQSWPDAPNHPAFPSIRLDPGQVYRQQTRYLFSRG